MENLQPPQKSHEERNKRAIVVLLSVVALVLFPLVLSVLAGAISQFWNLKAQGRVVEIIAKNVYGQERLVGARGERRQKYQPEVELTQFVAVVTYNKLLGKEDKVELPAGEVLGHNQPPNMSKYKLGEKIVLSYNPNKPAEAVIYDPAGSMMSFFLALAFILFWVTLALAFKYDRKVLARNLFVAYMILFGGGFIVLIPGCDKKSYIITKDAGIKQIYNENTEK